MKQFDLHFEGDKKSFDFKYYAQFYANRYHLNGTYQEPGENRIEVKVEGPESMLNAFLDSFAYGTMKGKLYNLTVIECDCEGFADFSAPTSKKPAPKSTLERISAALKSFMNLFS